MSTSRDHRDALAEVDDRLDAILPEEYDGASGDVQPVSMGSAALKVGADGLVAWDEMWATFCDLAMAGGPPHKGTLLEPATHAAILAEPERYATVVNEICRGVRMVTGTEVEASPGPGWIRVVCHNDAMAGWLLRAIVMENVAVRAEGADLYLPAGPGYRVEKEIKNVVTVIAKTCHYWLGHTSHFRQLAIGRLFRAMAEESPLVVPAASSDGDDADRDLIAATRIADQIYRETRLRSAGNRYSGWLGVECSSVPAAIWLMRAMVVSNVLARREGTVLFVPIHPAQDPGGQRVVRTLTHLHSLAAARLGL